MVRFLMYFNLFTDGVVRFGINKCLWMLSSLADGAVGIFVFVFSDGDGSNGRIIDCHK